MLATKPIKCGKCGTKILVGESYKYGTFGPEHRNCIMEPKVHKLKSATIAQVLSSRVIMGALSAANPTMTNHDIEKWIKTGKVDAHSKTLIQSYLKIIDV